MHDSTAKKPKLAGGHFGEQLANWGGIFGDAKQD